MIRFCTLSLVAFLPSAALAETITARTNEIEVTDGDTLRLSGVRVRLAAIDAPEMDQGKAGDDSRFALFSMIHASQSVTCDLDAKPDRYGRRVGTCFDDDGADLNEAMVLSGMAWAYRKYGEQYVPDEAKARALRLGVWANSDDVLPPWQWRSEHQHAVRR